VLSDYHVHTDYCDGKDAPEELILQAIKLGMQAIGISSHAPTPYGCFWTMKNNIQYEEYIKEMKILKERYKDQIQIYTGIEKDYYGEAYWSRKNLDYIIGSVHFMPSEDNSRVYYVDGNKDEFKNTLNDLFNGDIKKLVEHYFSLIIEMVNTCDFDMVGHLDVFKKNNESGEFFTENELWYKDIVNDVLDAIKEKNKLLEINSGGISRGYIKDFYPSPWILKQCKTKGINVVLNSDAHSFKNLLFHREKAIELLKEIGYTYITVLYAGKWKQLGI